MNDGGNIGLDEYNGFCKGLSVGSILYNIDTTNMWGDYLLVASISHFKVGEIKTYTVILLGLKKEEGKYIPRNTSISLTPDYANSIPFLKPVGYCKFSMFPIIEEVNVNIGLAAVYGNTDLHKFATKLSIRKPRKHKYGKDGKPVIKKNNV